MMRTAGYILRCLGLQCISVLMLAPWIQAHLESQYYSWEPPWDVLAAWTSLLPEMPPDMSLYWFSVAAACCAVAGIGFLYGRFAPAPASLYARRLPLLVWPLAIILCWSWAVYSTGGNYEANTTAWTAARLLSRPELEITSLLSTDALPASLDAWLKDQLFSTDGAFDDNRLFMAHMNVVYIMRTWAGIGAGLFFHLSLLAGVVCGDGRSAARSVPTGRMALQAPAVNARRGRVVLALLFFGAAGNLCLQIYRVERTVISSRAINNQEGIVSTDVDLNLYSPPGIRMPVSEAHIFFHSGPDPSTRLIRLDSPPKVAVTDDFPRLDGSTALYPLYAAAFHALYTPPPKDGEEDGPRRAWRESLACSTTRKGYSRLINGDADIFFGLEPSQGQLAEAKEKGVGLRLIPIGKEAFVFFVNEANPVKSLTVAQIQDIYTRTLTNWKELGGPDAPILPFQRPENSGSQTIMLRAVMQGKEMTAPLREELFIDMGGIVTQVAEYRNDNTSIGYSFRWYAGEMKGADGLRFLAVDGIAPTREHIADGTYPFTVPLYAVVRDEPAGPHTQLVLDWLTGPEGQALVAKVGYVPWGPKTPGAKEPDKP